MFRENENCPYDFPEAKPFNDDGSARDGHNVSWLSIDDLKKLIEG